MKSNKKTANHDTLEKKKLYILVINFHSVWLPQRLLFSPLHFSHTLWLFSSPFQSPSRFNNIDNASNYCYGDMKNVLLTIAPKFNANFLCVIFGLFFFQFVSHMNGIEWNSFCKADESFLCIIDKICCYCSFHWFKYWVNICRSEII